MIKIGLEIHAELSTDTKLFCSCATQGSDTPNTRTCPVCLGHPGSKPVLNSKAAKFAVLIAKALECQISDRIIFSRKSYFYPDMSKNYQITQHEEPIGTKGQLELDGKKIGIRRVHLEEDPASIIHPAGIGKSQYVLVDYNRSGNPLCEIVTEPDISSPKEARDVIKNISTILQCLGVHDPKQDLMKADVNISISETGYTRVEIKNISGFREIERALIYEIARQKNCHDEKIKIIQETRLWNPKKGTTESLRTKESDEDYGYIYDSDLVPVKVDWKTKLPEMPADKIKRYTSVLRIANDDAKIIASDFGLAQLFDEMILSANPVLAARWIRRELIRVLNYNDIDSSEMNLDKRQFTVLLGMLQEKKITDKVGQQLIEKLVVKPFDVKDYVAKQGLQSLSDTAELSDLCNKAVVENPGAAKDYREGKEQALNFLLGAVMKRTKGKADPKAIRELLKKILD